MAATSPSRQGGPAAPALWENALLRALLEDDAPAARAALVRGAPDRAARAATRLKVGRVTWENAEDAPAFLFRFGSALAMPRAEPTELGVLVHRLRQCVAPSDTALHLAARLQCSRAVSSALEAGGVDPRARNAAGDTAQDLAQPRRRPPQASEREPLAREAMTPMLRGFPWERAASRQFETEHPPLRSRSEEVGFQTPGRRRKHSDARAPELVPTAEDSSDCESSGSLDGFRGFSWQREFLRQRDREEVGREIFRMATSASPAVRRVGAAEGGRGGTRSAASSPPPAARERRGSGAAVAAAAAAAAAAVDSDDAAKQHGLLTGLRARWRARKTQRVVAVKPADNISDLGLDGIRAMSSPVDRLDR